MRLICGVVTSVLVSVLLALGFQPTAPAGAAAFGILPWELEDVVVDEAHGRVFVSGGAVVTTDLTGTKTGAVAGVSGARQMTLTPDGTQLVVARTDGISVVDPATATLLRTIPTGAGSCPGAVTPAAGRIFFSYGDCEGGTPGLGAVDLADDTVTMGIDTGDVVVASAELSNIPVMLRSVPAAPGTVFLAAGNTVAVLDVLEGEQPAVTVRASKTFTNVPKDVALNPAGTEVVAVGEGKGVSAFSTADLAHLRSYGATTTYASDFRADGRLAVNLTSNQLGIYAPGSTKQTRISIGSRLDVADRGMDYGAVRLYAAVRSLDTDGLSVMLLPVGPTPSLTITTDKSAYNYRATATVTIKLGTPTLTRTVSLYARPYGRDLRLVKTAAVGASSRTLVVKVPYLTYNTTFLVRFPGDSATAPASATRSVKVRAKVVITSASTSTVNGFHRLDNNPAPVLTFTVYPHHPYQCLRIFGSLLVNGTWQDISGGSFSSCVRTTSKSRLAIKLIGFRAGDRLRVSGTYTNGGTSEEPPPGGAGNIDSLPATYLVLFH